MNTRVYVDGLPASFTEEELTTLFSSCGTVLSVYIERGEDGGPIGIGHVCMARAEEAREAAQKLHHVRLDGKLLLVFQDGSGPRQHTTSSDQLTV
jgi:RNA recognition motif-containing protein